MITIKNFKIIMIEKAKENGIYENFGQKEIKELKDKYINISDYSEEMNKTRDEIDYLDNWASRFDLSQLKEK